MAHSDLLLSHFYGNCTTCEAYIMTHSTLKTSSFKTIYNNLLCRNLALNSIFWWLSASMPITYIQNSKTTLIKRVTEMKNLIKHRGVARNFMKDEACRGLSDISSEAQHFLQDCICVLRLSKESLDVWLTSTKQWLWSACTFADMWSCRKYCGPAHSMSLERVSRWK